MRNENTQKETRPLEFWGPPSPQQLGGRGGAGRTQAVPMAVAGAARASLRASWRTSEGCQTVALDVHACGICPQTCCRERRAPKLSQGPPPTAVCVWVCVWIGHLWWPGLRSVKVL